MVSAVLSRISALPTEEPDAPAIKNGSSPTISCLGDGLKSGRQDKTPCNVESMRKRVTFRCVFSSPAPQTASMRHTRIQFWRKQVWYHTFCVNITIAILKCQPLTLAWNMPSRLVCDCKYHWCKNESHKGITEITCIRVNVWLAYSQKII